MNVSSILQDGSNGNEPEAGGRSLDPAEMLTGGQEETAEQEEAPWDPTLAHLWTNQIK